MDTKAVLFDLDFTLAKPGPDLGPEGYQRLGRRFGLELDPSLYKEARAKAVEGLRKHPDFRHDEEIWVAFTERIIRGMGGNSEHAYECAVEMTRAMHSSIGLPRSSTRPALMLGFVIPADVSRSFNARLHVLVARG